ITRPSPPTTLSGTPSWKLPREADRPLVERPAEGTPDSRSRPGATVSVCRRGSGRRVVDVLGPVESLREERTHRIRGPFDVELQLGPLGAREVTQDVTGRVHASGRAPHPEPHPQIVRPGQRGRAGLQAVVPPGATAPLELERPEVDVHLVVHDDDPRRWNLVEPCQPGHRATGQIHVRTRFDQYRRYTAQAGLDDLRVGPVHLPALVLGG